MRWGKFFGRSGLEVSWGKQTECMGITVDMTFPLVLVCRIAAFEGWASDSDSESEESSEEEDSGTGFFTTGFGAGFVFRGFTAYRKELVSGEVNRGGNEPDFCFSFGDNIFGRNWRSVLNLDILWCLLLFCRRRFFRLFFVDFLWVGRLGHFGEILVTLRGSRRSLIMIMDSDVVLLGTDLTSSILAACVPCFPKISPVLTHKQRIGKGWV